MEQRERGAVRKGERNWAPERKRENEKALQTLWPTKTDQQTWGKNTSFPPLLVPLEKDFAMGILLATLTHSCFPCRRNWVSEAQSFQSSLWDTPACRQDASPCALCCALSLAGLALCNYPTAWWASSIWGSEFRGSPLTHIISNHLSHVFHLTCNSSRATILIPPIRLASTLQWVPNWQWRVVPLLGPQILTWLIDQPTERIKK